MDENTADKHNRESWRWGCYLNAVTDNISLATKIDQIIMKISIWVIKDEKCKSWDKRESGEFEEGQRIYRWIGYYGWKGNG